jgi:hypothetical protein
MLLDIGKNLFGLIIQRGFTVGSRRENDRYTTIARRILGEWLVKVSVLMARECEGRFWKVSVRNSLADFVLKLECGPFTSRADPYRSRDTIGSISSSVARKQKDDVRASGCPGDRRPCAPPTAVE